MNNKKIPTFLKVIFELMAIGLVIYSGVNIFNNIKYAIYSVRTSGNIMNMTSKMVSVPRGRHGTTQVKYFNVHVTFLTLEDGHKIEIIREAGSGSPDYSIGDTVSIDYIPGDPYNARISFRPIWFYPLTCMLVGIGLLYLFWYKGVFILHK